MKTYEEIVKTYKKRSHDTVVDTVATGMTYVDNIAVDSGLLEEAGQVSSTVSALCGELPFMVIAAVEGTKVLLGRKPAKNGTRDAANRMIKTGMALGAGSLAAGMVGAWAAAPAAVGTRLVLDKKKSRLMNNLRVKSRISRLQELGHQLEQAQKDAAGEEHERLRDAAMVTQGDVE